MHLIFARAVISSVSSEVSLCGSPFSYVLAKFPWKRNSCNALSVDDRNLLNGEFYCASSYSEHVTVREIARPPKFRNYPSIVNFPIVLRQDLHDLRNLCKNDSANLCPKKCFELTNYLPSCLRGGLKGAPTFCERASCFVNNVISWQVS